MNNVKDVVNQVVELVADNAKKMAVLGARTMVLGKFHDAVLPHLTPLQRVEVIRSFRQGIEDAMSRMDDVALPAEYHSTLLDLTNGILAGLGEEFATRQ